MGLSSVLDEWTSEKIGSNGLVTREDIDQYTSEKLGEVVRYAYTNSSFYREKYGEPSPLPIVNAEGAWSLEQFEKLPFTTSEELCERGLDFLCVKPGGISRIVTLDTAGSSGLPKRIYFTEEDQQLTVDFFEKGMQLMADSSDKVLILMPSRVPGSVGKLLAEGLRNFGAEVIEYGLPALRAGDPETESRAEAELLLKIIKDESVTGIVALPTHLDLMTGYHDGTKNIDSLKWVLLSAEYVADETVWKITDVFGCKTYEHYGMTEMGLGCAVSCSDGEGYHVREADLYIEIIDPVTGRNVSPGETGEIVFTTLTRKGMPLIRYRTGDYSRWLTGECCCGSILKRLAKVGSRDVIKGYLKEQR